MMGRTVNQPWSQVVKFNAAQAFHLHQSSQRSRSRDSTTKSHTRLPEISTLQALLANSANSFVTMDPVQDTFLLSRRAIAKTHDKECQISFQAFLRHLNGLHRSCPNGFLLSLRIQPSIPRAACTSKSFCKTPPCNESHSSCCMDILRLGWIGRPNTCVNYIIYSRKRFPFRRSSTFPRYAWSSKSYLLSARLRQS